MRIALIVSYSGENYHGWQSQREPIRTVQDELTAAVNFVANSPVKLICAGRTDSGVHATKQVVHFDTESIRSQSAWVRGVNTYLSKGISVEEAITVSGDFDARKSALSRRYIYLISNKKHPSPLMSQYFAHESRLLNCDAMHEAGQDLLGEHDFTSFRASNCQSLSPMRNLMQLSVSRIKDIVLIDVTANAFLQHMVRNIAGALIEVGLNRKSRSWLKELLHKKNRNLAARTASPNGLFLVDVTYPESMGIPVGPNSPHFFQLFVSD